MFIIIYIYINKTCYFHNVHSLTLSLYKYVYDCTDYMYMYICI